jgi:ADP-heptose:LPS heptosyltransferase
VELRDSIEERASDVRSRLELIERALAEEMGKNHSGRGIHLLHFLYFEKKGYLLALAELEALLQGLNKQSIEDMAMALGPKLTINRSCVGAAENEHVKAEAGERIYRMVTLGGISDGLLITPVLRALKQKFPDCKIHVYCTKESHKEVLTNNKYIDRLRNIGALTKLIYLLFSRLNLVRIQYANYRDLAPSLFYRKHAAEIMGEMLNIKVDDPRPDCFLTEEEEKEAKRVVAMYHNPVAIHVTAKRSPNKHWLTENWERLVQNNPHCSFLQIGSADDDLIRGVIDLRGTTLRRGMGIVKMAKAFIGVDSVFAQAAAAFRTPAVILFGASTPIVWGHVGNNNLYNPPPCSPCIDVLKRDPCPHGRTCMSNITVSDVQRSLSALIVNAAE